MCIERTAFISDFHFGHSYYNKNNEHMSIINFERTEFNNIIEHDEFIINKLMQWCKTHIGWSIYILGDFGLLNNLYFIEYMRDYYDIKWFFIYGNHDKKNNFKELKKYFNDVYEHPIFLTDRVLLSHEPMYPMPEGCINIHGHLHGAKLNSNQHICVSAKVINYEPVTWKKVQRCLSKIQKPCYKFLREPYRKLYNFTQDKNDVVYNNSGLINFEKSIELFNKVHGTKLNKN